MDSMISPASFIYQEMIKNADSQVVKGIAATSTPVSDAAIESFPVKNWATTAYLRSLYATQDFAADRISDYATFYAWVAPGRPWDHKSVLRNTYGLWSYDPNTGRDYYFDIWSNIHYGYIGRACGFGTRTLKAAAGVAQVKTRTVPDGYWERRLKPLADWDILSAMEPLAAFDDPFDQQAIILGANLWDSYGKGLTLTQFVTLCRQNVLSLSTRPHAAGQ